MKIKTKDIRESIRKNRANIKELGPGIITGGTGEGPAGIVTYSIAGARQGSLNSG